MTENLAAALAQLQTELPEVGKGNTAEVQTKTGGKYKYQYADLADVSKAILPRLGALGLSWVTRPTLNGEGKFVLAYELLHTSGESKAGEYPLQLGTPQEMGSAITYARRYALCSVTGVAPESDDDDAAHASRRAHDEWEAAKPATDAQTALYEVLKAEVAGATAETMGAVGAKAKSLRSKGELTPMQYERLDKQAAARLVELGGAA
ncbi:MAG TPA: ERF family protein [Jiangellaceae bacterium]